MNLDPAYIQSLIIPWGIKIITALAIFIIGKMLAKWLTGLIRKVMKKSGLDEALIKFLGGIIYTVLLVAVILANQEIVWCLSANQMSRIWLINNYLY